MIGGLAPRSRRIRSTWPVHSKNKNGSSGATAKKRNGRYEKGLDPGDGPLEARDRFHLGKLPHQESAAAHFPHGGLPKNTVHQAHRDPALVHDDPGPTVVPIDRTDPFHLGAFPARGKRRQSGVSLVAIE